LIAFKIEAYNIATKPRGIQINSHCGDLVRGTRVKKITSVWQKIIIVCYQIFDYTIINLQNTCLYFKSY